MVDRKFYCSRHGPRLVCNCEHPLMVHMCEFGNCCVEIYAKDESFCDRHEADNSFLARGGPINIVNTSGSIRKRPLSWKKELWKATVIFIAIFLFAVVMGQ